MRGFFWVHNALAWPWNRLINVLGKEIEKIAADLKEVKEGLNHLKKKKTLPLRDQQTLLLRPVRSCLQTQQSSYKKYSVASWETVRPK